MPAALDSIHAIALVTCFALLGTSRIGACIRWLSLQGILLGLVPLIAHDDGLGLRVMLLASGNIALKGVIFPWVLLRLRARTSYPREVEPFCRICRLDPLWHRRIGVVGLARAGAEAGVAAPRLF